MPINYTASCALVLPLLRGARTTQLDDKHDVGMCHTCPSTVAILKHAHVAAAMKRRGGLAGRPRIVVRGTQLRWPTAPCQSHRLKFFKVVPSMARQGMFREKELGSHASCDRKLSHRDDLLVRS